MQHAATELSALLTGPWHVTRCCLTVRQGARKDGQAIPASGHAWLDGCMAAAIIVSSPQPQHHGSLKHQLMSIQVNAIMKDLLLISSPAQL